MELTSVNIDAIVALAKQKQTKWCLQCSTEDLVLIKVLRQTKGYDSWLHCFIWDNCERHEFVSSRKLVFWMSNWKPVIKYDLYVKFPWMFAHNVQICAKLCCKNFNDVCQVFQILHHYTWGGGVFSWTRCTLIVCLASPLTSFFFIIFPYSPTSVSFPLRPE